MIASLFLAPLVIADRMPRLWWEAMGGNPFGEKESVAIVTEKLTALQKGTLAANSAALSSAFALGNAMMRGNLASALSIAASAPARVTEAALMPAARRVSANVKRLRKV